MPIAAPIRLLLTSCRRSYRKAARAAIESYDGEFAIAESADASSLAADVARKKAQIVLLIDPEMHELMCDYLSVSDPDGRVPVIAIGRKGSKPVTDRVTLAGLDGYLPFQELHKLPRLAQRLLADPEERRRESSANQLQMSVKALRESQKLISVGRLTAEIAHEINNPLESVGNFLYLAMCEPNLSEKAMEYLRGAERELGRVTQISKQTLSFNRESDQPSAIRMDELMDEVVALYQRRILHKELQVTRQYQAEGKITALSGEMRQVFSNLVTNAIEASAVQGRLILRIHEGVRLSGNTTVRGIRVTVADNGSGIPAVARTRLGELFFTTKGQGGTGLGLWVTRQIVTRLGGTMQLKSSTGAVHGTVFSLFLPFVPLQQEHREAIDKAQSDAAPGRLSNVSSISDHPAHRESTHSRQHREVVYSQKRNV